MAVSQASLDNDGNLTTNQNLNDPPPNALGTETETPVPEPVKRVEDDLERELRLANEEQARLDAAKAGAAPAAPASPATPAAPAAAAPAASEKAPPGFVPVKTALAERDKRQLAERQAAYWQGQAEARAAMPATAQSGAPAAAPAPVETPAQVLERVKAEQLALADQYDQGTIKTREWEEQRQKLQEQEWNARQATLQPAAPQMPIADALLEEQETQRIERQYPILAQLGQGEFIGLQALARAEAMREGKPIEASVRGTIDLRERVAKLAVRNYGQGPAPASPTATATPAQHRNAATANLAVNHPVDVSTIGAGAAGTGMTDDQALAAMSSMNESQQIAFMNANPAIVQRAMQRQPPAG